MKAGGTKFSAVGTLLLVLSCHGEVTRRPDRPTTLGGPDASEATAAAASSSAEPESRATPTIRAAVDNPTASVAAVPQDPASTAPQADALPTPKPQRGTAGEGLFNLAVTIRSKLSAKHSAVFSPLGIGALLGAFNYGACGKTREEIAEMMGLLGPYDAVYWGQLEAALAALSKTQNGSVQFFSTIFMNNTFVTRPGFESHIDWTHTADVVTMNLTDHPNDATYTINHWVETKTGYFRTLLQKMVDGNTIIASSTLYYNAPWYSQFPTLIRDKFVVNEDETRLMDLMHHHSKALYARDTTVGCKVLGVPYKDDDFALFFVLPDEHGVIGLQNLEARLTGTDIMNLLNSASWHNVSFYIPKMHLQGTHQMDIILRMIGLEHLFTPKADLREMVNTTGNARAFVSKWMQCLIMEVMERGKDQPAEPPTEPHLQHLDDWSMPSVRVDRPFLMVLMHRPTGIPVIWGSIVAACPCFISVPRDQKPT